VRCNISNLFPICQCRVRERDVLGGEIWYSLLSSSPLSSSLPVRTCLFLGPVSHCVLWQSQKMMARESTSESLSWKAVHQLAALQHCLSLNPPHVQRWTLLCQAGISVSSSCFPVPSGPATCSAQPWCSSPDGLVGAGVEIFCPWHHLQTHGKGRNMFGLCLGETFNPKQAA